VLLDMDIPLHPRRQCDRRHAVRGVDLDADIVLQSSGFASSESVNQSPAVARRFLGVPNRIRRRLHHMLESFRLSDLFHTLRQAPMTDNLGALEELIAKNVIRVLVGIHNPTRWTKSDSATKCVHPSSVTLPVGTIPRNRRMTSTL
jgi:hypothetical protein